MAKLEGGMAELALKHCGWRGLFLLPRSGGIADRSAQLEATVAGARAPRGTQLATPDLRQT